MKRTTYALAVLLAALISAHTAMADFKDIADTHANKDAVDYMKLNKIVEGYPDGSYQPDRQINRAEFTKIIIGAYYDEKTIDACKTSTLKFSDADKKAWYAPFVCLAVEKSIIEGYPDGTFKPDKEISFVEAAKIISVARTGKTYNDPIWYKPYVESLESDKAIPETIKAFSHRITRGEMAEMVYRVKEKITTKKTLNYTHLKKEEEKKAALDAVNKPADSAKEVKQGDAKADPSASGSNKPGSASGALDAVNKPTDSAKEVKPGEAKADPSASGTTKEEELKLDPIEKGVLTPKDVKEGELQLDDVEKGVLTPKDVKEGELQLDDVEKGVLTPKDAKEGELQMDDVEKGVLTPKNTEEGSSSSSSEGSSSQSNDPNNVINNELVQPVDPGGILTPANNEEVQDPNTLGL